MTNKSYGVISIAIGIFCLVFILLEEPSKSDGSLSDAFLIKHMPTILFVSGGAMFITNGILLFKNILPIYHECSKSGKDAWNVITGFFLLPFWTSISYSLYALPGSQSFRILWSIASIYLIWLLLSSSHNLYKTYISNEKP